jgi:hypothetical protein
MVAMAIAKPVKNYHQHYSQRIYHRGARVEFGDDGRHEPDILTPEVLSCRSDENRSQCTEGTEKREEYELTVSCILIFRESTEIGHVDGERGEETNDDIQCPESGP